MALEHEEVTEQIIGAAIEVHKTLGPGFIESVYEPALVVELRQRSIPFARQVSVQILYRDVRVGRHRLDFFVANQIVVEIKAVRHLEDVHFAVVKSYLRVVGRSHGLMLNFAKTKLEIRRVSTKGFSPGFMAS